MEEADCDSPQERNDLAGERFADVEAARGGNEDAFARLVERFQPVIARMMWKFTRDQTLHRELTQEVFVQAYFSLKSYRRKAPFEHWLRRIATRAGYRFWRERTKEQKNTETFREEWTALHQADQSSIDPETAGIMIHNLMEQLSPRNRIVLTLLYWENVSVAEAAERLGWSRTMVKVQAFRARAKLKNLLEEYSHE